MTTPSEEPTGIWPKIAGVTLLILIGLPAIATISLMMVYLVIYTAKLIGGLV
jgi:hypothetical protein